MKDNTKLSFRRGLVSGTGKAQDQILLKREKVNNPDHAHILSGILKCPCCGKSMYGNIAKAHSKDKKTRYYYYCKKYGKHLPGA